MLPAISTFRVRGVAQTCRPVLLIVMTLFMGLVAGTFAMSGQPAAAAFAAPLSVPLAAVACAPDSGGGSIMGQVTRPGGIPVKSVNVQAYTTTGQRAAYVSTDDTGTYTLSGLITGNYLLYFDTSNTGTVYAPEWYNNQATATTAMLVAVTDGMATTGINVELAAGSQFSGRVIGEDSLPLQSVNVRVYDSSGQSVGGGYTDAAGNYTTTPGLPSGDYRIFFDTPIGKPYLAEYYTDQATLETANVLSVTAPAPRTDVDAVLARGAQISGRVTSAETGDPLVNIRVSISGEGGSDSISTNSSGFYTSTAGLRSGSYTVSFRPIFDTQNLIVSSQTVSVTVPNMLSGVDAVLSPGGILAGMVTAPDNTPIQSVSVYVSNTDGSYQRYVYTAADGTYTAMGLPSGSYRASFRKNGYISEIYDDQPGYQQADLIPVTAPDTTADIDAVLAPGGSISGKVTDATTGMPIELVFVEVLDQDGGRVESAFTNAAGEYTMPATLASGTYRVRFNPDNRFASCGYVLEYYNDRFNQDDATLVPVTAPNTTANINAEMSLGSNISGRVTEDGTGAIIAGINVSVYNAQGDVVASGRTTFTGGYLTTPGVPSGDYRVLFRDYDTGYIDEYYSDKLSLDTANAIPITAPNTVTGIDAALAQGGTISGRVTAGDTSAALAYVSVMVYDADGNVVAYASTDKDGRYQVLAGLPSGDYRVGFKAWNECCESAAAALAQGGLPLANGYLPMFYRNSLSLANADPVNIISPNETTGIDVVMKRGTYLPLLLR